jgi:hypothetical protein
MSELLPEGEEIRRAVKWISQRRTEKDCPPLYRLIEEASVKFNLGPADAEFLERFLQKETDEEHSRSQ